MYLVFIIVGDLFRETLYGPLIALVSMIPIVILRIFGLRVLTMYVQLNNEGKRLFDLTTNYAIQRDFNNNPVGYFCGWPYVAYLKVRCGCADVTVITTKSFATRITGDSDVKKRETIYSYQRYYNTNSKSYNYMHDVFDSDRHLTPWANQDKAIAEIVKIYKEKNGHCSVFLHGNITSGKSTVPYLLSPYFKALTICEFYNPTEPGDGFSKIYSNAKKDEQHPLIVVLDEVDILLNNIHNETIQSRDNHQIEITNKVGWSRFLDQIDRGCYKNIILVMTSNKSKAEIDKLDPAYLRDGRVNLTIDMSTDKTIPVENDSFDGSDSSASADEMAVITNR